MTSKSHPTLGERLKAARVAAGLSTRELGKLAGIDHSYLFKLEEDRNARPAADKLQRLAEVLELDPAELLAYIGVDFASTLPSAPVYFRRKYGLSEHDADELAKLVDNYTKRTPHEGGES